MNKIEVAISKFEEQMLELYKILDGLTQDQIEWKLVLPLGDDYWSVREIVAHVEEVNYFWPPKLKALLADPTGVVERTPAELDARQQAVTNAKTREWSELYTALKKSADNMRNELSLLTDEQFSTMIEPAPGHKLPLSFLINHVYGEHVEEHIKHIQRQLFAYSQYH